MTLRVNKTHRPDGGDQATETLHGLLVSLLEQLPDALVHDLPGEHPDPVELSDEADVTQGPPPQLHLLGQEEKMNEKDKSNNTNEGNYLSCKLGRDVLLLLLGLCLGEILYVLGPVQILHVVLYELCLAPGDKKS